MITRNYRFAEQTVQVTSLYDYVHRYCKDYQVSEPPVFTVMTGEEDIALEREKSRRDDIAAGQAVRAYAAPYLESLAVYRKIAEQMPAYDTLLFHGSVVAVDGEGYLFTAKSGTGKSTHTQLWLQYFGERAVIVNDDKPLLRVADGIVTAYGTPYNGKHRRGCPMSVSLRAICALERSETNHIERVGRKSLYPMLLQQSYRPSDPAMLSRTLTLLDRVSESVGLYRLGCNMDIEAAKVSYNGMKG